MTRTADPLERLHAVNPVAAVPAVDWERIQQHVTRGASEPRDRRPRLLALAGAGCAGMLVLAGITVVLLSRATTPGGRAPSSQVVCDGGHIGCPGTSQVGVVSHGGVLQPLTNPNPSVKPAAAQSCAVLGPRCVQGCAIPVASRLRSLPPAWQGCTTKTASQPCIENVAGTATKLSTAKALRELQSTERLLDHAAPGGASPSFCRPLLRDLPTKRFPHRTRKRR
jgi:hypothetical protein